MAADRERILNLPGAVTLVLGVVTIVQSGAELLPSDVVNEAFLRLSFVPARITFAFAPEAVMRAIGEAGGHAFEQDEVALLLGGAGAAWHTLLTYALLHGNWTHLLLNCATLAAFGSPVARRFGANRFLVFLSVCAIAGALAHLLAHPFDLTPVVGASAAISGTMAAAARFAFAPGTPLGEPRRSDLRDDHRGLGAPTLAGMFSNRRAMVFLALWFGINLLLGVVPEAAGASNPIAWEAHIGGFSAGLLLFGAFDPPRANGAEAGPHGWQSRGRAAKGKREDSL